jgi:hypothetical protein
MVTEAKKDNKKNNELRELYQVDDYLWLQKTIDILSTRELNKLDIDNLIEELESLSKRDFSKVRSLLRQIIIHLLLLEYWQEEYKKNHRHWQIEVIAFRDDLNHSLTRSLFNKLNDNLENIYQIAVKLARKKTGFSSNIFPVNCPYSLEKILDENWLP